MDSRTTSSDAGCSSSEEDGKRAGAAAAARRRHPFSVEALMSRWEPAGSAAGSPPGGSPLHLCRERCALPGGDRRGGALSPPVKCEGSEDWVSRSGFSTQPRRCLQPRGFCTKKKKKKYFIMILLLLLLLLYCCCCYMVVVVILLLLLYCCSICRDRQ